MICSVHRHTLFCLGTYSSCLTACSPLKASWNPADDDQAIDRAYRLGQNSNVEVYRLLCGGTIEAMMYDRQAAKESLKQTVIGDLPIGKDRHFDPKDLKKLFFLTDPKQSDLREKFQGRGVVPDQERHQVLRRHKAFIDIFSHDELYTSSPCEPDDDDGATDVIEKDQKSPHPPQEVCPRSFLGRRFAQCLDDGDNIIVRFGTVHQFFPRYESDEAIEKWSVRFDDDAHKGNKKNTGGKGDTIGEEDKEELPPEIIIERAEIVNGVDLYETNKLSDPNYSKKQKLGC
jgi:hypothetical protein